MTSPAVATVPLWTRSYTLSVVTTVFIFIPWALFQPVLPIYVLEAMHGSSAVAGAATGVFLIAMALFRAQTDRLERLFGKRLVLTGGALLFAALNLLYLAAGTTHAVLVICFLTGACFAVINTSLMARATEIIPLVRKGEGLGYLAMAVTVATAVGPFTGLSLVKLYGFGPVFFFCCVTALVGSLVTLGIEVPRKTADRAMIRPGFSLGEMFETRAVPASVIILLLMFGISAVFTFVSVYARSLHLAAVSAYFFVVLALCAIFSRLVTGRIYDRRGPDFVIYPAIVSLAAALLILGRAHNSFGMFAAAALVGISYGTAVPNLQALAFKHSPGNRTSVVTATYFTLFDLGMGAGSYVIGVCIPALGYANLYLLLSPVMLAVALLYYVICGKKELEGLSTAPST